MKRVPVVVLTLAMVFLAACIGSASAACNLRIGVTLHPYYSWAANIVGDTATVRPLIPPGSDPASGSV